MQKEAEAEAQERAAEAHAFAAADAEVQRMSMHAPDGTAAGADADAAAARPAPSDLLVLSPGPPPDDEEGAEAQTEEQIEEPAAAVEPGVSVPPVAPEPYTAAEVQARVAAAVLAAPVAPQGTCMALMMLCMEEGWHGRAGDVMRSVFQAFPACDWIAATLPAEEHPPDALSAFDCLAPLPSSPFPANLYLLHRCASLVPSV